MDFSLRRYLRRCRCASWQADSLVGGHPVNTQATRSEIERRRYRRVVRRANAAAEKRVPPECLLQGLELVEESHGIQRSIHGHQPTLIGNVEDTAGQHSLEWCLSRSVRPPYATARPRLGRNFID